MADGGAITWTDWDDVKYWWPSQRDWAEAWWRASRKDLSAFDAGQEPANHPDDVATRMLVYRALDRDSSVVPLVVSLSELAKSEEEIGYLGAGEIETLVCRSPGGELFIDSVEDWASRSASFREAISYMWVGDDVSADLRRRLLALGAIDHRTVVTDD